MAPYVSVIIPTYNRADLLPKAVNSVLGQTFRNFELIIVDDGSTDHTENVARKISPSIIYIRNAINKGGSAARNIGIKAARGEFISLLDDDDEWYPHKLQKQVDKFKELSDDFGLVYSGFCFVSKRKEETLHSVIPSLRGDLYKNLLETNFLGSPTPLIKSACFKKVGYFDENLPSVQDWDMWIRISRYYKFDFVPDILANHYVHQNQISGDINRKILGREILIDKIRVDLLNYPSIYAEHLKQLGILCCLAKKVQKGRIYFLNSLKLKPFKKSVYLNIIFSLVGWQFHRTLIDRFYLPPVREENLYN